MKKIIIFFFLVFFSCSSWGAEPEMATYECMPPLITAGAPPIVMMVMDRSHKLYYEAYNDASDLNGDGILDVGYNPSIDYYGYFDSYKYYKYNSSDDLFEPKGTTANKKAPDGEYWSGDFLNYMTMSRMDCLRKVLYGGFREIDTSTETVLRRAYIPRDGHSWGKEYQGLSAGYDIREYTPLDLPETDLRHLFANVTYTSGGDPTFRVAPNSNKRIWEWVSTEGPVCSDSKVETAGGNNHPGHPGNSEDFQNMVDSYATPSRLYGSGEPSNGRIDGEGNPFGPDDNYLTIFTGKIRVESSGDYTFSVNGDDAVEVLIDGVPLVGWYGAHGKEDDYKHTYRETVFLDAGLHDLEFRHEEATGGDNYYLWWRGPDSSLNWEKVPSDHFQDLIQATYSFNTPGVYVTEYIVRVQVGLDVFPESNCRLYPSGVYKPIGILQRYGESNRMYFGLMTGSYTKNTSGGVLRSNIASIENEIDPDTGEFLYKDGTINEGILQTLDKLRVIGFDYGSWSYNQNCGWITTKPLSEGHCRMWGNPIGEMIYETVRYFSGAKEATEQFTYGASSTLDDNKLGLPQPAWIDPYDESANGFDYCSQAVMLVLSDIYPSYDSDQLPGSEYPSSISSSLADAAGTSFSAAGQSAVISTEEFGTDLDVFIGESPANDDCACTPKTVSSMSLVRGLCPEEPTKQGSYYSAAGTFFGRTHDLHSVQSEQDLLSYCVGLASPRPEIRIQVPDGLGGSNEVVVIPFAKSVGGYSISAKKGDFQPTNTIVDYYVTEITPTSGSFRINFEDVEQGADHDMDAIVRYDYEVDAATGTVTISLDSEYAAGSIIQHMGYIISGTTQDGTYLEVRDVDTSSGSDPDYFLDTPPGILPGTHDEWKDYQALPLQATRTFTPSGTQNTQILRNPLWYAAKWGGFEDRNGNNKPDLPREWDNDGDDSPDTYFYVTNPLRLEEQLNKSFADILRRTAAGTAVSTTVTSEEGEGTTVQSFFKPSLIDENINDEISWVGYIQSLWVDSYGNLREDTNGNLILDIDEDMIVKTYTDAGGETRARRYHVSDEEPYPDTSDESNSTYVSCHLDEINALWKGHERLWERDASTRNIFTYIDEDNDDKVDSGEVVEFTSSITENLEKIMPYLGIKEDSAWIFLGPNHYSRATNLISYIRGIDINSADTDMRARTYKGNVWKLGDIVHSTPMSVSKPVENYHVIYSDESYLEYYNQYKDRETMIYVGANDGMLHAFTSWRYDQIVKKFTAPDEVSIGEEIGDEVWAYIPESLLPHLKWLANTEYSHVYYVDSKPKIFDAPLLENNVHYSSLYDKNWGTFLLCGLRMGGKEIKAEGDFDYDPTTPDEEKTFSPVYFLMDITDPRNPKLMWERSYDDLGMTLSQPAVVRVQDKWFAVFGSGPQTYEGGSYSNGHVFVIDLANGDPYTNHPSGKDWIFQTVESQAFFASPAAFDKNLNFCVDAVYLGESYEQNGTSLGKLYKLTIPAKNGFNYDTSDVSYYDDNPLNWDFSPIFEADGSITAAPSLSVDTVDNVWVYFGTGRLFSSYDKTTINTQYFYGIKDPFYNFEHSSEGCFADDYYQNLTKSLILNPNDLMDSDWFSVRTETNEVYNATEKFLTGKYEDFIKHSRDFDGWKLTMNGDLGERVLEKPLVIGGTVLFTTYVPNDDICAFGGDSYFYGVYYETGAAYTKDILHSTHSELLKIDGDHQYEEVYDRRIALGAGKASGMNIHVGQEPGAKVNVQMSSGNILQVDVDPALNIKSRLMYWKELDR